MQPLLKEEPMPFVRAPLFSVVVAGLFGTALSSAIAQDSVHVAWIRTYLGPDSATTPSAIALDRLGNIYVVGSTYSEGPTNWDFFTLKYSPDGTEEWVALYNRGADFGDNASTIAVDDSGNLYTAGSSGRAGGPYSDFTLVKYNTVGVQQWAAHYNGPDDFIDGIVDMVLDTESNVYVTGYSYNSGATTIKYNPQGEVQWIAIHEAGGIPMGIAIDDSNNTFVTGYIDNEVYSENSDYLTIKYNPEGEEQWAVTYNGAASEYLYDIPTDVVVDADGNIYVTGLSEASHYATTGATIKYGPTGTALWTRRLDASGVELAIDANGFLYFAGSSSAGLGEGGYVVVKYTSDGDTVWRATYDGGVVGGDYIQGIFVDGSGNVYVTGTSTADIATLKFDSSGEEIWVTPYGSGDAETAEGFAVSPSGEVIVAIGSYDGTHRLSLLIKYVEPQTEVLDEKEALDGFSLQQNYPNPFNPSTTIEYKLSRRAHVRLEVYNVLGERVSVLRDGAQDMGYHRVDLDGKDLPSGIYFYRLQAGNFAETKKLVLMR